MINEPQKIPLHRYNTWLFSTFMSRGNSLPKLHKTCWKVGTWPKPELCWVRLHKFSPTGTEWSILDKGRTWQIYPSLHLLFDSELIAKQRFHTSQTMLTFFKQFRKYLNGEKEIQLKIYMCPLKIFVDRSRNNVEINIFHFGTTYKKKFIITY